jgi:hypothetical protein
MPAGIGMMAPGTFDFGRVHAFCVCFHVIAWLLNQKAG